jgi:hypothetical protein
MPPSFAANISISSATCLGTSDSARQSYGLSQLLTVGGASRTTYMHTQQRMALAGVGAEASTPTGGGIILGYANEQ